MRYRQPTIALVIACALSFLLIIACQREENGGTRRTAAAKPRVVISSDFPPLDVIPGGLNEGPKEKRSDPDDIQSVVRFLTYTNEFRIEGLIASAATLANIAAKQNILDILTLYGKVERNLLLHDPAYPPAATLREVTWQGLDGTYGRPAEEILGEGKDSEASEAIIRLVDGEDPEPIWFCFWGGSQELGQALWKVRRDRTPEDVARFVSKIRVYFIARQDGSASWILDEFPGLFAILSENAFKGMFVNAKGGSPEHSDLAWLNKNIRQDHGPLGAAYPPAGWDQNVTGVVEGDSPSFLYIFSGISGLSELDSPSFGGWGGRFEPFGLHGRHWVQSTENELAVSRWQVAMSNDFAARMDRCVEPVGDANRAPSVVLNRDTSRRVLRMEASPGSLVKLNAAGTADPDGNGFSYHWWQYREAGSYDGGVEIKSNGGEASFTVPDAPGKTIHVILEVTDSGLPPLTSYRRLVVTVSAAERAE